MVCHLILYNINRVIGKMKAANSNNKVKQLITHAKTIPIAIYQLMFLNFVLFVGIVCRELSLIYIFGTFTLVVLSLVVLGRMTSIFTPPEELVTQNIKYRVQQILQKLNSFFNQLNLSKLQSNSINTIVAILMTIYVGSAINSTIEVFIIFNFVFLTIFLPQQTEGFIGVAKQGLQSALRAIKYKK